VRGQVDAQQGRIAQLEQALDQTLAGLEDARSALAEQAYLEAHLAEVEETANVQWQAIVQLNVQLQRQMLPATDTETAMILPAELYSERSPTAQMGPNSALAASPIDALGYPQPLDAAQEQLAGLEAELAKQMQTQALLQQACLELESARAGQQARLSELEQQSVEMQEQILSQAQQASEDETAIQHWKDRAAQGQVEVTQLRALLFQAGLLPPSG
jgi:hypothetical protein